MPINRFPLYFENLPMSLKKSSLLVLVILFALFFTSMLSNVWLLIRSNHSLDDVNKEIRVVLSIIDPINHSRTSRVRVMEYMKEIENGDGQQSKSALDRVTEVIGKADAAFRRILMCRNCLVKVNWPMNTAIRTRTIARTVSSP